MGNVWWSDHRRGKTSRARVNLKTAWDKIITVTNKYQLRELFIKETEAALPPFFPLSLSSSPADGRKADDTGL